MDAPDTSDIFNYKELFAGEILNYTKADMEYAVSHNLDLSNGVINKLNAYNQTFKVVKTLIRVFWGRINYLIENPQIMVDFIRKKNPTLFEVEGAEEYIKRQIQKAGYAIVEYLDPPAKLKVKLDIKALKYQQKMDKKKKES
jgi:hypothetical protein